MIVSLFFVWLNRLEKIGKNVDLLVGSSCFHDCQLNMSCFNEDNNWYPDGKFCPQEFRTVSTAGTKFVVILVGDSRIRQLFAGVAQALLGLGGSVLRYFLQWGHAQNLTLHVEFHADQKLEALTGRNIHFQCKS